MSWSISLIGTPDNVVTALNKQSENLSGQSKIEYDSVLPALIVLAQQNFCDPVPVIKITANGHGVAKITGEQVERYCQVLLERIHGLLV